jgi:hypothetical protein
LAFVVAACGAGASPVPSASPTPPVVIAPPDPPPGGDDGSELVVPVPGQKNVLPVPIDELRAEVTGRRVVVVAHWTSGVAPCFVLDSVLVNEQEGTYEIGLREGTADPDAACIMIAQLKSTRIDLGELEPGTYTIQDMTGAAPAIEVVVS